MKRYFEEKLQQIEPETIYAFGIALYSRYGKAREIIEMLKFAELAACQNVAQYVKRISYDGKSCCCSFDLVPCVEECSHIADKIHLIAQIHIAQFVWLGHVEYGHPFGPHFEAHLIDIEPENYDGKIFQFLIDIEKGFISLNSVDEPQNVYSGNVTYEASNGWKMSVFNDCNEWDYINWLDTPDGHFSYDDICKMNIVKQYRPSEDIAWMKYKIPGYLKFRCNECEVFIEMPKDNELYLCEKCKSKIGKH